MELPKLYLAEWLAGGCIICGKRERGRYHMSHQGCWPYSNVPLCDEIITVAQLYKKNPAPPKTPEQLKAELESLAADLMGEW